MLSVFEKFAVAAILVLIAGGLTTCGVVSSNNLHASYQECIKQGLQVIDGNCVQ